ncbi:c-type cytochrome [Profundibacter sp.]
MTPIRTLAILAALSAASPALAEGNVAKGEKTFKKCKACHMIVNGDEVIFKGGKTGPNLYGIIGRAAATTEGFKYGKSLTAAGVAGLVWDEALVAEYAKDPKAFLKAYLDDSGAKSSMSFRLKKGGEDVAAFLASVAPAPEATEGETATTD